MAKMPPLPPIFKLDDHRCVIAIKPQSWVEVDDATGKVTRYSKDCTITYDGYVQAELQPGISSEPLHPWPLEE